MPHFAWLHVLTASPSAPSAGTAGLGRIAFDLSTFVRRDVGLSKLADAQGMRRFRERFPDLLMLVLTVHTDDPRTVADLCSAACDYLLKKTPETPPPHPIRFRKPPYPNSPATN
jgi:DNA-binding NarL/FixJ family response regulator